MNRREVLAKTAMAAGALYLSPLVANASLPTVGWIDPPSAGSQLAIMEGLAEKVKAGGIKALTWEQWNMFGTVHQTYMTFHAQSGDLHRIDLAVKANEAYLKTKFTPSVVDSFIQSGSYAVLTKMSAGMHQTATKLKGGVAPPINLGCEQAWSSFGVMMGIVALIVAPEVAVFFAVLGLVDDMIGMFTCA